MQCRCSFDIQPFNINTFGVNSEHHSKLSLSAETLLSLKLIASEVDNEQEFFPDFVAPSVFSYASVDLKVCKSWTLSDYLASMEKGHAPELVTILLLRCKNRGWKKLWLNCKTMKCWSNMSHNPVSMETFFSALFIFDMILFVTIETEPKPSTLQLAVLHPLVGVFIGPVWRSLFWLLQVFYLLSKQGYQSPFSLVPLVI